MRCFNKDFTGISINIESNSIAESIAKASYPELITLSDGMRQSWFSNYIQKIAIEDPRHLYNLEKAEYMPPLLQSLAVRAGSLVNDADIGRDIGLNAVTTRTYRGLLSGSFITQSLKPWYRNVAKRLVKSGKIFFYDSMLLSYLLGSTPEKLAKQMPQRFRHILENFVFSELSKINHATGDRVDISFYRTNDGREIDFVLESNNKLVATEVKNSEIITEKDLTPIKELKAETGDDFVCGIILCNTKRVITFDKDIYLVPISALWSA